MANAGAANFNGTNQYLLRGGDLAGIADSKSGTLFAAIRRTATSAGIHVLFNRTSNRIEINFDNNQFRINGQNAAGTNILQAFDSSTITDTSSYHFFLASWDLAIARNQLWIDDANRLGGHTETNDTIDYAGGTNWSIAANTAGGGAAPVDFGPFWFKDGFSLDITQALNRAKFHTPDLKVALALVSDPTSPGASPIIWLNNTTSTYHTNLGSGGGFTVQNGPLGAATGPEIESASTTEGKNPGFHRRLWFPKPYARISRR